MSTAWEDLTRFHVLAPNRPYRARVTPAKRGKGSQRPTFVWVVDEDDMTVKQRTVVPDVITARGMRLKEGVKTGEWIVTAGVYSVVEGQKVRISKARSE